MSALQVRHGVLVSLAACHVGGRGFYSKSSSLHQKTFFFSIRSFIYSSIINNYLWTVGLKWKKVHWMQKLWLYSIKILHIYEKTTKNVYHDIYFTFNSKNFCEKVWITTNREKIGLECNFFAGRGNKEIYYFKFSISCSMILMSFLN